MLRSILNQAKIPFNHTALVSRLCTKAPNHRRFPEINDVTLVGTLINDSYTLKSGTNQLTLRTQDTPTTHSNHNVRVKTEGNYEAGQRIFVSGKLGSISQKLPDQRTVTTTSVRANKLFVLENECGSLSSKGKDENSVQILGNIANDISVKDKDCSFSVATHFTRNEQGEEMTQTDYHRVFAYDADLRNYIQIHLAKSDRVYISGKIGHMTYTGENEKKIYSGFIVAESISKIARRVKSQDESTESGELKQEN